MQRIFYTDGSTKNNGYSNSSGGYGVIEVKDDTIIYTFQDFKSPTTNNEMELMAILHVFKKLKNEEQEFIKPIIYSDSAYCVNIINTWMYNWEQNNWMRPHNQEIKNLEIIKQIYNLKDYAIVKKVKGHSDNKWNNYVDKLATGQIKLLNSTI